MLTPGTIEAFRLQAEFCGKMGSPLYGELLARAAEDIQRGGSVAAVLDGWTGNPIPDALALRLMGAVHRLVLEGTVPQLARYYPSAGGRPQWPATWEAFERVIIDHAAALRLALARHVQTNEVRRSAALLAGFLTVAATHTLPLRILEIGSSAGLNLGWDRYQYAIVEPGAAARHVWGDRAAPVTICTHWHGPTDLFATPAAVDSRAGCDVAPIDVTDDAQVRLLESFIWPDQPERLLQLRCAIGLARRAPPPLVCRSAADWLGEQLATSDAGAATVVFHSIMWWYLSEDERDRVSGTLATAGARATARAPLAWLRLELMTATDPELRLTQWPGGAETVLARADAHGRYVEWASGGGAR
jgi:hypothetical protein